MTRSSSRSGPVRSALRVLGSSAVVLVTLACITVNVYFPEAEIKELSESIEREVREQAATGPGSENPGTEGVETEVGTETDGSRVVYRRSLLSLLLAPAVAHAQRVAPPEVTNPAIRKIIDSRAQRLDDVLGYLERGVLGEANDALLEIRDLGTLELRERATVQKLVREENADRNALFREIAAAKNVDRAQLPEIQSTYAETLRQVAASGTWIQLPDGTWKRK